MALQPICIINVVGLTSGHIGPRTPQMARVAGGGALTPLRSVLPAVTCPVQATILTGARPSTHGIVGNGWLDRETGEVRFWQQSHRLIQGETLYAAARRIAGERGEGFTAAKLFWWFNQGAPVDFSVTPKPHYGSDGSKVFGIAGDPPDLTPTLESKLGPFPFFSFWGPASGLPATDWIARATAEVIRTRRPTLTLTYLPHLDYDFQRHGPDFPSAPQRLEEVDRCVGLVIDAAMGIGAEIVILSEYGIVPVRRPILINRTLRTAGWLAVRTGPFGEMLDTFASKAFAVVDHQVAHVYVRDEALLPEIGEQLLALEGVARVLDGEGRRAEGLEHPRAGDLVLLADPDAWFAYPYWLEDREAPDFARTVDIHRKPGFDPCELFLDPKLTFPSLRVGRRLLQKALGFRMRMDVIPLDPHMVGGSHGLVIQEPKNGPVLIASFGGELPRTMMNIKEWVLGRMGLIG